MQNLTTDNVKQHCRTCLMKLNLEEDAKDCINLANAIELRQFIDKYVGNDEEMDFPQHLCFGCSNKLHELHKFMQQAQECTKTLKELLGTQHEPGGGNPSQDTYRLMIRDSLMETEIVLLHDTQNIPNANPDPFIKNFDAASNKEVLKFQTKDLNIEGNNKKECDWTKISSSECESNKSSDSFSSETEDFEKPATNCSLAKRSRKAIEESPSPPTSNTKKKKRRTKKEMEQFRRKELEQEEETNKIKRRRQKGTKNTFKCSKCNHCFAHKITLDAHIRKIHEGNKRPFRCDRCDKSYTFIGGLYTHIKEIHEAQVRQYNCDFPNCDRIYTSFIAMQKHKRLKHTATTEQKKYICEQCGATFQQTGNLKYHRRTKHPTEEDEKTQKDREKERYECTICKKLFHSRYTLKYHTLQLHTNETKYECNVCGRKMAKKFMLAQHMLVHSTEKMPCEHCGKQFIRKFELEAHIKAVHMKLKPFECQFCLECFASRKTLRHHEYIHTGEKPYVCDICGQAYRQQTCLKNHRKSHEKVENAGVLNQPETLSTSLKPTESTAS